MIPKGNELYFYYPIVYIREDVEQYQRLKISTTTADISHFQTSLPTRPAKF